MATDKPQCPLMTTAAGLCGPVLTDYQLMEKMAHFNREPCRSGWCTPRARLPTALSK